MATPNISSQPYNEMFKQQSSNNNGLFSALIVIVLFSVLSGLFGYLIGDRKILKRQSVDIAEQNAKEYTQEELDAKINKSAYDFKLYNDVIANLKDKYVNQEKVDDKKLFEGSIKGLVESVGDPATNYFTAEEYKEYLASFSGTFEGIGVRLEYQANLVLIAEVFPNSPAEKAGVKVNFVFSKVEGKDVTSETMEEIIAKVRGESGTKVRITFFDNNTKEEVEKEITRAPIEVESIRLIEKDSDTAVLEISRFTEDTLSAWNKKWDDNVQKILNSGYKNIIIDMRGNGGGFLEAAIYAANDFVEPGKILLTERSREEGDKNRTSSNGKQRLKDKNVVILINGNTASASEILAGALKFNKNYKIIGTKSYGKGTVQKTYNLPDGGALKITTEYWILPDGKHLDNENPIHPDIEIKQDAEQNREGKDNVLDKAIETIKAQ